MPWFPPVVCESLPASPSRPVSSSLVAVTPCCRSLLSLSCVCAFSASRLSFLSRRVLLHSGSLRVFLLVACTSSALSSSFLYRLPRLTFFLVRCLLLFLLAHRSLVLFFSRSSLSQCRGALGSRAVYSLCPLCCLLSFVDSAVLLSLSGCPFWSFLVCSFSLRLSVLPREERKGKKRERREYLSTPVLILPCSFSLRA